MKLFGTLLATIATLAISGASFAADTGTCTKDGHDISKDHTSKESCEKAGGTWKHEEHK